MRQLAPYGLVVVLAVVFDQAIKIWAEASLPMQKMVPLLPFFALFRTYNYGVSFSLFSGTHDMLLAALSVAVVLFVLWLASRTEGHHRWSRLGFALVIGGALGNLIDRTAHGYVIDYFLFHTPVWSFAVFNLADVFITLGAGLVILQEVVDWRAAKSKPEEEPR